MAEEDNESKKEVVIPPKEEKREEGQKEFREGRTYDPPKEPKNPIPPDERDNTSSDE